eukprot:219935-Lingulodinium_polyedra.AAC.1
MATSPVANASTSCSAELTSLSSLALGCSVAWQEGHRMTSPGQGDRLSLDGHQVCMVRSSPAAPDSPDQNALG